MNHECKLFSNIKKSHANEHTASCKGTKHAKPMSIPAPEQVLQHRVQTLIHTKITSSEYIDNLYLSAYTLLDTQRA